MSGDRRARLVGREVGSGYLVMEDPADETRWYVTECCLASAKGSVNSATGVCCRACYAEVDPGLGGTPRYAVEPLEHHDPWARVYSRDLRDAEDERREAARPYVLQYQRGVITVAELAQKLSEVLYR